MLPASRQPHYSHHRRSDKIKTKNLFSFNFDLRLHPAIRSISAIEPASKDNKNKCVSLFCNLTFNIIKSKTRELWRAGRVLFFPPFWNAGFPGMQGKRKMIHQAFISFFYGRRLRIASSALRWTRCVSFYTYWQTAAAELYSTGGGLLPEL